MAVVGGVDRVFMLAAGARHTAETAHSPDAHVADLLGLFDSLRGNLPLPHLGQVSKLRPDLAGAGTGLE